MDLFGELEKKSDIYLPIRTEMGQDWYYYLSHQLTSEYSKAMTLVNDLRRQKEVIYPLPQEMFLAFRATPPVKTKVIILGQDPYFNGEAMGLAFGCRTKISASLEKILEAVKIQHTPSWTKRKQIDLSYWAEQGVLLLNSRLAVRKGSPKSLTEIDWNSLTSKFVVEMNKHTNLIWLLWGEEAKQYSKYITNSSHLVLTYEHPAKAARESRSWNCTHFREVNIRLKQLQLNPIHWI